MSKKQCYTTVTVNSKKKKEKKKKMYFCKLHITNYIYPVKQILHPS